jgi:hypothetical protein
MDSSHEDIVDIETADKMGRIGSEHPFKGLEQPCVISIGVAKKAVRDWTNKNHSTQTGKRTYITALC